LQVWTYLAAEHGSPHSYDPMKSAVDTFLAFWRRFDATKRPFVHPEDQSLATQGDFELNLLPLPVNGNLTEAECVVLMLNPGLDPEDYEWEKKEAFRNSIVKRAYPEFCV
jgi:hypothetical protein